MAAANAARARGARPPRSAELSLADLERLGVEIRRISEALEPAERETGIAFSDGEKVAEVSTADYRLQRKLERAGIIPQVVNAYQSGGTIRLYYLPRSRLSVNVKRGRV